MDIQDLATIGTFLVAAGALISALSAYRKSRADAKIGEAGISQQLIEAAKKSVELSDRIWQAKVANLEKTIEDLKCRIVELEKQLIIANQTIDRMNDVMGRAMMAANERDQQIEKLRLGIRDSGAEAEVQE